MNNDVTELPMQAWLVIHAVVDCCMTFNCLPVLAPEDKSLQEDTFLMRKLETLASQIGNVGVVAAAAVLAINCGSYTLGLLHAGQLGYYMVEHLQVRCEIV